MPGTEDAPTACEPLRSEERLFVIDENGDLHGLWTDDWDVRALGECHCERASDVVWCQEDQQWHILLPDGTDVGSHRSREGAIQEEIRYLQARFFEPPV